MEKFDVFFKNLYIQAAQISDFFKFLYQSVLLQYYKLKRGECLCIAHELRVKVVNCDINYLSISPIEKFEINLAYK